MTSMKGQAFEQGRIVYRIDIVMKMKKEIIELLLAALSEELTKIEQRAGDSPAYHSVYAIAKYLGETIHWSGQHEAEKFREIMVKCVAIREEHQAEVTDD